MSLSVDFRSNQQSDKITITFNTANKIMTLSTKDGSILIRINFVQRHGRYVPRLFLQKYRIVFDP